MTREDSWDAMPAGCLVAVRPGPRRTVEVGGRCALVEIREYDGSAFQ
ncbi:MAG: hypothetical protein ABIZ52_02510 [Candidatus Limnocylindrales bacterium]